MVLQHSEETNSEYKTVEKKHHQFQNQCCYDDALLRNECPDCKFMFPIIPYLFGNYGDPVVQITLPVFAITDLVFALCGVNPHRGLQQR